MSTFVNEHYIIWLKQYTKLVTHSAIHVIAKELIASLPNTKDINKLIALLNKYINPHGDDSKLQNPTLYGPVNFYAQLLTWQLELENINKDFLKAEAVMQDIAVVPAITPLIRFLKEIMAAPEMLLFQTMPTLLTQLCDTNVPNVLKFLANLVETPFSVPAKPGSLAASNPFNSDHKVCLDLFNSLSKITLEKDALWTQAHDLVQSALLTYQQMNMVEINLKDDEKDSNSRPKSSSCVIM
jgi:hypothetical protein